MQKNIANLLFCKLLDPPFHQRIEFWLIKTKFDVIESRYLSRGLNFDSWVKVYSSFITKFELYMINFSFKVKSWHNTPCHESSHHKKTIAQAPKIFSSYYIHYISQMMIMQIFYIHTTNWHHMIKQFREGNSWAKIR